MQATGNLSFGGTFPFGVVVADITTEDGHKYHFRGYMGEIATPNVGYGTNFSGDFPGLDHIDGSCWFQTLAGGGGPGGCEFTCWDSHGPIGTLTGQIFGGGFDIGLGGGTWSDEEFQASEKKK